jgi:hypothetical protein
LLLSLLRSRATSPAAAVCGARQLVTTWKFFYAAIKAFDAVRAA